MTISRLHVYHCRRGDALESHSWLVRILTLEPKCIFCLIEWLCRGPSLGLSRVTMAHFNAHIELWTQPTDDQSSTKLTYSCCCNFEGAKLVKFMSLTIGIIFIDKVMSLFGSDVILINKSQTTSSCERNRMRTTGPVVIKARHVHKHCRISKMLLCLLCSFLY